MKVMLRSDNLKDVPNRWNSQYRNTIDRGDQWDKAPKTKALLALPEGFSEEQVNTIIGNNSWTSFDCDECRQQVSKLISFDDGDPDDYDTSTICVCVKCLKAAVKLIKE